MPAHRKINPLVQAHYDGLNDDDRADLERRMLDAGRVLADLRIAKSTGKLDERLLVPKGFVVKNSSGYGGTKGTNRRLGPFDRAIDIDPPPVDVPTVPDLPSGRSPGEKLKLPKDIDLPAYIKDALNDGRTLADFYLGIVNMTTEEARKQGVYMNHRLMAASWLGDRGWGKAKGDESGEKGLTINIVDYSGAETPAQKKISIEKEGDVKEVLKIEGDVGRDLPANDVVVVDDLGGTPNIAPSKEIEVEEVFSLRD